MIRFAILAGVSTDGQAAEEKTSIPSQIETCRRVIAQHGVESAGPYILDGYTRSGYDSLADAMDDIPPLQAAIEAATANQYDILIVDNFDRFGDLAYMIGTRYKKLKKQIYSARQSGRVVSPGEYDPYADDAINIHMHVGGIIQGYRINKLRRGYSIGVPARIDAGLHSLQIPYGYELQRRDQPAIPIPEQTALLVQMKNWLFDGLSLTEITRRANESGIPTKRGKRWDITAVRRVLDNPYYAGLVAFGKTSAHKRLPRSRWMLKPGSHQPLWDAETYNKILSELDRRQQGRTRKTIHTLSGLCVCTLCGSTMYRGGGLHDRSYLSCNTWGAGHPMIEYKTALKLIACEIAKAIHIEAVTPSVSPGSWDADLKLLTDQRARVQEGYETGIYNNSEALKKITAIEKQIDDIKRKIHEVEKGSARRKTLLELAQQSPEALENWVKNGNAVEVNRVLQSIISGVIIAPNQTVQKIDFR
jgi:hypothetical protein